MTPLMVRAYFDGFKADRLRWRSHVTVLHREDVGLEGMAEALRAGVGPTVALAAPPGRSPVLRQPLPSAGRPILAAPGRDRQAPPATTDGKRRPRLVAPGGLHGRCGAQGAAPADLARARYGMGWP